MRFSQKYHKSLSQTYLQDELLMSSNRKLSNYSSQAPPPPVTIATAMRLSVYQYTTTPHHTTPHHATPHHTTPSTTTLAASLHTPISHDRHYIPVCQWQWHAHDHGKNRIDMTYFTYISLSVIRFPLFTQWWCEVWSYQFLLLSSPLCPTLE